MTEPLGYHVLPGELLLDSLRRVGKGEDPDLVFAELWANASHEKPAEEEGWPEPHPLAEDYWESAE